MSQATDHLSDNSRAFVEAEAREKGYESPDEYLESLVMRARKKRERLEALLLEGLESGDAGPFTPEDWEAMRREAMLRIENRAKPR